jgi:hypothetical protein
MTTSTHITTSGGLISAAFTENVRQPASRQRGVGAVGCWKSRGDLRGWGTARGQH